MLNMTVKTSLTPRQIIERAQLFFGPRGYGLKVQDTSRSCVTFNGDHGSVRIVTCRLDDLTAVDIRSDKWDYQTRIFVSLIGSR